MRKVGSPGERIDLSDKHKDIQVANYAKMLKIDKRRKVSGRKKGPPDRRAVVV